MRTYNPSGAVLFDVVVQPISTSEDRTIWMVACLKAGY